MIETLPTCALVAVPVAVNCVEEMRVVVSAVEPKFTVAPCAKCAPVMCERESSNRNGHRSDGGDLRRGILQSDGAGGGF